MMKWEERARLETMPFAMAFITENGNEELCNATGYEVKDSDGMWYSEYEDSDGNLHYGR